MRCEDQIDQKINKVIYKEQNEYKNSKINYFQIA